MQQNKKGRVSGRQKKAVYLQDACTLLLTLLHKGLLMGDSGSLRQNYLTTSPLTGFRKPVASMSPDGIQEAVAYGLHPIQEAAALRS